MRIEFYLVDAMEVDNFAPIYRALRATGVDVRVVVDAWLRPLSVPPPVAVRR